MVEALARAHGQRVIRGPVGESQIVDLGLAEGAVLAGEGSGGVAVLPLGVAYDGLLALGLVLEEMATSGTDPGGDWPAASRGSSCGSGSCPARRTWSTRCSSASAATTRATTPTAPTACASSWDDAWLHVRASGTEPLLRIIAEAPTPERAEALVDEAAVFARRITFGHEGS